MPAPLTLLLDLDGTLVDAHDAIVDGVLEVAAERGLPVPERAWAHGRIGHDPLQTWVLLGDASPEQALQRFGELVLPRLPGAARVLPGVAEALAALAGAGFVLAVATTRLTQSARDTLEATGLQRWVGHVSGRDLVERPKPAPDVLLHALSAVGGRPERAVMIGDSDADVLAARAAGMPAWAVLGGIGDEPALRAAGADLILSGLGEVPGALAAAR